MTIIIIILLIMLVSFLVVVISYRDAYQVVLCSESSVH